MQYVPETVLLQITVMQPDLLTSKGLCVLYVIKHIDWWGEIWQNGDLFPELLVKE